MVRSTPAFEIYLASPNNHAVIPESRPTFPLDIRIVSNYCLRQPDPAESQYGSPADIMGFRDVGYRAEHDHGDALPPQGQPHHPTAP
jgi:hypothetical protein